MGNRTERTITKAPGVDDIVHSNRICSVMSEVPRSAKFLDRVVRRGTFPLEESGRAFRTSIEHFPRGGKRRGVHGIYSSSSK